MLNFFIIMAGPLILIHLFFGLAVKEKNFGVIDVAWALGFIVISLTCCVLNDFSFWVENLVCGLVIIWGLRLSIFLFLRNFGKPEDHRYEAMRQGWGDHPNLSAYFKVYLLQYVIMLFISAPLLVIHFYPVVHHHFLIYPGIALWILGFVWEAVADYQKSRFKSKPGNSHRFIQEGLWKLSRHPNYFGEATSWWGIFFLSAITGNFLGVVGVGLLNFLLLKVSGVPLVEKRHESNPEWISYKAKTPTLIPSLSLMKRSLS